MELIKKIDIHAHATAFGGVYPLLTKQPESMITPEELIEKYDELGIEKGVLLPLVSPEGQAAPITSENCKIIADKYPDRFAWFCGVDPRSDINSPTADLSIVLMHYKSLGAKGVGELTARIFADDPKMDNLFYHCAQCDMPVTIHVSPDTPSKSTYGIIDEKGLPRIEKMLKKHKKLKIIGHSQPFWAEISADLTEDMRNAFPKGKVIPGRITELMREYENLYCDLSAGSGANAMMRDPEHAARFIEEFADRIYYGCDFCAPSNIKYPYAFKDFIEKMREDKMISEENYRKIVRENALKLLSRE